MSGYRYKDIFTLSRSQGKSVEPFHAPLPYVCQMRLDILTGVLDKRPIHVLHLNQFDSARSHAIQISEFCLSKPPTLDPSTMSQLLLRCILGLVN